MNEQKIINEMQGFIGLGMKRDAFALAKACFQNESIHPLVFAEVVNAVLTFGGEKSNWRSVLESAFKKVPGRLTPEVRFAMLSFYADYLAASRFIPRKFTSDTWLAELVISLEVLVELKQMPRARRLANACHNVVKSQIPVPFEMQVLLIRTVALYFSAARDWDNALNLWQGLRLVDFLVEEATFHCVQIRLEQANEEIRLTRLAVENAQTAWKSGRITVALDNFGERLAVTSMKLNRTRQAMNALLQSWNPRPGS